jgi:hypothetical protein
MLDKIVVWTSPDRDPCANPDPRSSAVCWHCLDQARIDCKAFATHKACGNARLDDPVCTENLNPNVLMMNRHFEALGLSPSHKTVEIEFVPHPRLTPTQRSTIAREYEMKHGLAVIKVRRAILFYMLDEMRLLKAIRQQDKDLADVPIWVKNPKHIADELAIMDGEN